MNDRELSFKQFMEEALYDPVNGYYAGRGESPSKAGDFVTSPVISPAFPFALAQLFREFLSRTGDGVHSFVDVGCADGALLRGVREELGSSVPRATFFGVDRAKRPSVDTQGIHFVAKIKEVPAEAPALVVCNELYDAFPFSRLVMRQEGLHELWVRESGGSAEWFERAAGAEMVDYLARNEVELETGQFADVSLEWESFHLELTRHFERALFVIFDYGYEAERLFSSRVRRFGTAAAYQRHKVHRDLLASKGENDLTAHVNFSDLVRAGKTNGCETLLFDRQAGFLLKIGVLDHPDLAPADAETASSLAEALARNEKREEARRLILPDGIGQEMRVLVQVRGIPNAGWSFQRSLI